MENNEFENIENPTVDVSTQPEIVGNAVLYAVLSYIGILWLIGLLAAPEKDTAFVKNHVNNGVILTIAGVISGVVNVIPVLGQILSVVLYVAILVFSIMGIVKACQKNFFVIPLIGDKLQIIK